jgi:hypothetical protein
MLNVQICDLPLPALRFADEDIAAALEVERLSADDPIDMLSSDPDRFFGRTTKASPTPNSCKGCIAVQLLAETDPFCTTSAAFWALESKKHLVKTSLWFCRHWRSK